MDRRSALKGAAAVLAAATVRLPTIEAAGELATTHQLFDLDVPEQAMDALVKMRADLTGAEVAWYWTGNIWGMVPGEGNRKLFDYDGFSMARFDRIDGGFRMLNREVGVYREPTSGKIGKRV